MSIKAFDIIVYGATGFTGRLMAKYIHGRNLGLKWAIAGRSQAKLATLMTELIQMQLPCAAPALLLADAEDPRAMRDTFAEAKIVLNCTGPYRFLGKDILEACVKAGATYMDICGEPQFMEDSFLQFNDIAQQQKTLVIHACAFDSVPADLGCLYAMRQFPPQRCSSIESFLTIHCPKGLRGNVTTFECAVHGIADSGSLSDIRKKISEKYKPPKIKHTGPTLKRVATYAFDNRLNKYVLPFKGADASVVRSSHRALSLTKGDTCWPQYGAYMTLDTFSHVATYLSYGTVFSTLATFPAGRSLLLSYPETFSDGIFSRQGPTEEHLQSTSFEMLFIAKGYSSPLPDQDSIRSRKVGKYGESILSESDVSATQNTFKPCGFLTSSGKHASSSTSSRSNSKSSSSSSSVSAAAEEWVGNVPDKEVRVLVSGPEPGYVSTPAIFLALVQCVLEERSSLPAGGVFTPAAAFFDTPSVFDRLERAGISFRLLPSDSNSTLNSNSNSGESSSSSPATASASAVSATAAGEVRGGASAAAAGLASTNSEMSSPGEGMVEKLQGGKKKGGREEDGLLISQAKLATEGDVSALITEDDDVSKDGHGDSTATNCTATENSSASPTKSRL